MTKGQTLNHDFNQGMLTLYDINGNITYQEDSTGSWYKCEYDSNDKVTYFETSNGYWIKHEFDTNSNEIYYETSDGLIRHSIW